MVLGRVKDFLSRAWLPVFILGWSATAFALQTVRALMLDENSKLYVTAARARGLYGRRLMWRYPARHALGPIINSLGFDLNRVFNELPIVALILTLTEAGALLLEALARRTTSNLPGAIIFLLTASIVTINFPDRYRAGPDRSAHPQICGGGLRHGSGSLSPNTTMSHCRDRMPRARKRPISPRRRPADLGPLQSNALAMIAATVLLFLILMGLFAPFLSPYDPRSKGRDKDYTNGAPQIPQFCDHNGCSAQPFIYGVKRERSIQTNFRWVTTIDTEDRRYLQWFVRGDEYKLVRTSGNVHLFGVDKGFIHLFGTDDTGKDIFSRTLHAIYTSLAVGTLGVLISFVLALIIGGVAGYFGGMIDGFVQMVTDAVRTIPIIRFLWRSRRFCPPEIFRGAVFLHLDHHRPDQLADAGAPRAHPSAGRAQPGIRAGGTALRRARRATSSAVTCCRRSPATSSSIW